MKGQRIQYSHEELDWIQERSHMQRAELTKLFVTKFNRSEICIDNIKSLCTRKGWRSSTDGRFAKGSEPWSKGKKIGSHPNSKKTQFKKGATPSNRRPLWSERINKLGYVEMKVPEPNPYTDAKTRFAIKHVYLWTKENGEIPEGHVLKCLDGDKTNCDPSNWEAIPQSLIPRLNGIHGRGYDKAPEQLKPTIMAIVKLEQKVQDAR